MVVLSTVNVVFARDPVEQVSRTSKVALGVVDGTVTCADNSPSTGRIVTSPNAFDLTVAGLLLSPQLARMET
jgi:hypothetical protein